MNSDTEGNGTSTNGLTEEQIIKIVDRELSSKHSLSVKYWYPTLISVVLGALGVGWWFYSVITPIEKSVLDLQKSKELSRPNSDPVIFQYFLEGINGSKLSSKQLARIQNAIYMLKERNDLVAIVAGYERDDDSGPQSEKIKESEAVAETIRSELLKEGILGERIFSKAYGVRVPLNFPKKHKLNACIMLCDIFVVMQNATY